MPPLTLALLASLLQVQGANATITSDNKGLDDLLATIRTRLADEDSNTPRVILAAMNEGGAGATPYQKNLYMKKYVRSYTKWVNQTHSPSIPGGSPSMPERKGR